MQLNTPSGRTSLFDAVVDSVEEEGAIRATYAGGRFTFSVLGNPLRVLTWDVNEAELRSLVSKMGREAKKAFGRHSAGWSLLMIRLEEELLTFADESGHIVTLPGGNIEAQSSN